MKGGYEVTQPHVVGKILHHGVQSATFEANNGGDFYSRDISSQVKAAGHACNILAERASSKQSKMGRIIQHAPAIREFYFKAHDQQSSEYRAFMKEVTSFTQLGMNKNDDAPDSLAGLANKIRRPLRVQIKTMDRYSIGL